MGRAGWREGRKRRFAGFALLAFALSCDAGSFPARTTDAGTKGNPDALDASNTTPTKDASGSPPLRVVVISDMNGSYGSTAYEATVHGAIAHIQSLKPDLVLSTGDMVAGQKSGLNYASMWSAFHAAVSDPLTQAGIPFAVTPGNHDASGYAPFAAERNTFVSEWTPRKPNVTFVDDANYPLRYAFTMGEVLFVSLDDTTVGPLATEQMTWLEGVLTANEGYPAKVVFGHLPLYPFATENADEVIGDTALETLLNAHHVTALVTGHHHAYYPGKRSALRMVGLACLGTGARRLLGTDTPSKHSYVSFEIDGTGIRTLEAYAEPNFDVPVLRETLPTSVGTGGRVILRDDM
ncbi:MAG: metallophosphoesterase [Myxococcales bacterium]|nr:metallophosphoesterase [Myxococcales bacterium]